MVAGIGPGDVHAVQSVFAMAISLVFVTLPVVAQEGTHEVGVSAGAAGEEVEYWAPTTHSTQFGYVDLVDLSFEDSATEIAVYLAIADRDSYQVHSEAPTSPLHQVPTYEVDFAIGRVNFTIEWDPGKENAHILRSTGPHGAVSSSIGVEATQDGSGYVFTIPRERLVDPIGRPLLPGETIERAVGRAHVSGYPCVEGFGYGHACAMMARDRFPQDGHLDPWIVASTPPLDGHLLVYSTSSNRVSNGEATSYLFDLHITNYAQEADDLTLRLGDNDFEHPVAFPSQTRVASGQTQVVPIIVDVPFRHEHGTSAGVEVTLSSSLDQSIEATQEFIVEWVEPPQPTGHHRQMFLHRDAAGLSQSSWWMNTLRSDAKATDGAIIEFPTYPVEVAGVPPFSTPVENSYSVHLPISMDDGLRVGVDADMDATGALQVDLGSHLDATAILSGELRLHDRHPTPEGGIVLMDLEAQEVALAASSATSVTLPVAAREIADYLSPQRNGMVALHLWLEGEIPATMRADAAVLIAQGKLESWAWIETADARMDLPVHEFHDRIGEATSGTNLSLQVQGPSELAVAPGATRVFELAVDGPTDGLDVTVSGLEADWMQWHLESTENDPTIYVAVAAPETAAEGGVARFVVLATADGSHAAQVIGVRVDSSDETDETALYRELLAGREDRRSPAPGVAALAIIAVLTAAAYRGTRR